MPSDSFRKPDKALPTLEDVAKLAGVSTATVSRCLNSPERVIGATRIRVKNAVDELGYSPNFGARILAAKRTNTIGAIIPTMENAIFARGIQAFQEELGKHGITLLVASSSYQPDLEEEQIRTLTARGADALLLIGHDRAPEVYDYLERRRVPYLIAWAFNEDYGALSIGFKNRDSMRLLAEQVIDLGHHRIGVISADRKFNDRARERAEGILQAMENRGLDADAAPIIETVFSIESGGKAFQDLMALEHPPTAVMCGNDVLAVGALAMARQIGLSVPGDVSITGFDDIELARITEPQITTVHVPHREMGGRAAHILAGMLNGDVPRDSVQLETNIIHRGSLGPVKK